MNLQRRSLRWVNFNPDGKSCPKDFYVRQESVRFCFWSRQCARIGKIGSASWDPLVDFAEAKVRAIEKKAGDDAEKRRSGSYRLDGEYETLVL